MIVFYSNSTCVAGHVRRLRCPGGPRLRLQGGMCSASPIVALLFGW